VLNINFIYYTTTQWLTNAHNIMLTL